MLDQLKTEKDQEKIGIAVEYDEYKKINAIDQDSRFQINKNIQNFNLHQNSNRMEESRRNQAERKDFKDEFINDLYTKKEVEYNQKLEHKNNNVSQHMRSYQNYLKDSEPSFVKIIDRRNPLTKSINLKFNNNQVENENYQSSHINKKDEYMQQESRRNIQELLEKQSNDQRLNSLIPTLSEQPKSNLQLYKSYAMNPILSGSRSIINLSKYNPGGFYENFQSDSYKQIRNLTDVVEANLIAKLRVKIKALGVDGIINLYHQFSQRDYSRACFVDYNDFRSILISTYKVDFPIEDLRKYLIQKPGQGFKVNYKDFLYTISQYDQEHQKFVDFLLQLIDKNQDGLVDYNRELMLELIKRLDSSEGKLKEHINDFIRSLEMFFLRGQTFSTITSRDFHIFFSCFSIKHQDSDEFIRSVKSIFGV